MKHLILFLLPLLLLSQEKSLSKMDKFLAGSGNILRLENHAISGLMSATEQFIEAKVRRATFGNESQYFLLLSNESGGKYSKTKSASIAEEDLKKLIASINTLKQQAKGEPGNIPYVENKFITDDGFQVGYFTQEDDKVTILWFITLEKYGDATFLFRDSSELEATFKETQAKIKELKAK